MKTNQRKKLLPLFIREIVKMDSDSEHHCSQEHIRERLSNNPFFIEVDRKAVSRSIKTITLEDLNIYGDPKAGYWYDKNEFRWE